MAVTVSRYPSNRPGDDITSPILISTASQIFRGTQQINKESCNMRIVTCKTCYTDYKQPGKLTKVIEHDTYIGKLTSFEFEIQISDDGLELESRSSSEIEVPKC